MLASFIFHGHHFVNIVRCHIQIPTIITRQIVLRVAKFYNPTI